MFNSKFSSIGLVRSCTRWVGAGVVLVGVVLALPIAAGARDPGRHLMVVSRGTIDLYARRKGNAVSVRGAVSDDMDEPVVGVSVRLSGTTAGGARVAVVLAGDPSGGGTDFELLTDEGGRFLATIRAAEGRRLEAVVATCDGTASLERSSSIAEVGPPSPDEAIVKVKAPALWWSEHPIESIDGTVDVPGSPGADRGQVEVRWDEEAIGSAKVDTRGQFRFPLPPGKASRPGYHHIEVRYKGTTKFRHSRKGRVCTVNGLVGVRVLGIAMVNGALLVPVKARVGQWRVGSGVVQLVCAGRVEGEATVSQGRATIRIRHGAQLLDSLRSGGCIVAYKPRETYYKAGPGVAVELTRWRLERWKRWLPILLGGALLTWLAFGWRRPARNRRRRTVSGAFTGRLLGGKMSLAHDQHVTGLVLDAHEALPVRGARVNLERRGFEKTSVIKTVLVDDHGRFNLGNAKPPPGSLLRVSADGYDDELVAVSMGIQLRIALTTRRRSALARLVDWARTRGGRWFVQPEPSPGDLVAIAEDLSPKETKTASWARGVERQVYGPAERSSSLASSRK